MQLTATNMIHYLLGNGLADTAGFVNGHYTCRSNAGRHKHFIINKENQKNALFIKQAKLGNDEKINALTREGYFYKLAAEAPFNKLQGYLPNLRLHDENNAAILFEYYGNCINLYEWLFNNNNQETKEIAIAIATGLHLLHSIKQNKIPTEYAGIFSLPKPWVLSLHEIKNNSAMAARSQGEEDALQLVLATPGFTALIESAAAQWESSSFIHGDCKLNNYLLNEKENRIKWIDWELFSNGDPLWDVATVFQSALIMWVADKSRLPGKEKNFTATIQTLTSSLWKKYTWLNKWNTETEKTQLLKCTSFTALRLLHACFESTPEADALQPYSARLLQLAHNILLNPQAAHQELLGIKIINAAKH